MVGHTKASARPDGGPVRELGWSLHQAVTLASVVEREAGLHASNVQLVCPECGKATRVGRRVLADGRKVRICRKCEGVVDK